MLSVRSFFVCALLLAASLSARADFEPEWVEFPALKPFNGEPVMLKAMMVRPDGAGPHPAVVMLHGCGGFYTGRGEVSASYRIWAETLARHGHLALLVDSLNPRGRRSICREIKRTILIRRERVDDAYAALHWLARREDVRADRIGLIGWSNGGSGALYSLLPANERRPGFRSAVAFYPGCAALGRASPPYHPYAPLLMLAGGADDWTPAAPCAALADAARARGADVEIEVYAGAHHGFDRVNSPVRFRPDVRNPNRPGGRGATVGGHASARADSMRRALAFFEGTLKVP